MFGARTDRGERDTRCVLNNWKSEPSMNAQKKYVSAHRKNFDLYDHP